MFETACYIMTIVCSAITCIIFVLMLIPPRHHFPTPEEIAEWEKLATDPCYFLDGCLVSEEEYRAVTGER